MTHIEIKTIPAAAPGQPPKRVVFDSPDEKHNVAIANLGTETLTATGRAPGIDPPLPYEIYAGDIRIVPNAYLIELNRLATETRVVIASSKEPLVAGLKAEAKQEKAALK